MNGERGSAKLIRERMSGSREIGERDLQLIAGLVELDKVVLARWWWKGQPAPDLIAGAFHVPRHQIGDVIGTLLQTEVPLVLKVFPKGIPWPEDAIVTFQTGVP